MPHRSAMQCWEEYGSIFLVTSEVYWKGAIRSSQNHLFSRLDKPTSLGTSSLSLCSSPLTISEVLQWTHCDLSTSFSHWEAPNLLQYLWCSILHSVKSVTSHVLLADGTAQDALALLCCQCGQWTMLAHVIVASVACCPASRSPVCTAAWAFYFPSDLHVSMLNFIISYQPNPLAA